MKGDGRLEGPLDPAADLSDPRSVDRHQSRNLIPGQTAVQPGVGTCAEPGDAQRRTLRPALDDGRTPLAQAGWRAFHPTTLASEEGPEVDAGNP